ncbi:hypothetical protein BV210_16525 [Halorientalis sp. IM1011]|uniref:DUF5804 family protein n=1 Tax=Halorientalis sp. IM1011 TaxID=1932360 RepID=UPI00097CD581|nr:DUF5804 family protein [Halorientalis sp. IM1011]AQL44218.1 hypothetical protein BV210_16525 [Halorientalis sp. IM1011]
MTQVCLVGDPEVNLRYELLSRETARNALATYDLREPFENTVVVETVSLGAAVALLNDLNWYLVRFTRDAFLREPSVSETEWLSRDLAAAVRDDEVSPDETERFLKIYGVEYESDRDDEGPPDAVESTESDDRDSDDDNDPDGGTVETAPDLVEPMYAARTGPELPEYDLRDVSDTLVVRVAEDEFGGEKQR